MAEQANKGGTLGFLYHTVPGRILLKLLTARWISKLCGAFLNTRLSKPLIGRFVRSNHIDLSEYESDSFRCFNDCFCRKVKEGGRPIPQDETVLFSPCDGLLSAYRITDDTVLPVKQSAYTIASLLQDETLAKRYQNGVCLVFRLCVNHYHRYCYPATGMKGDNVFLGGRLHTVRPIALEACPVFVENCREYTVIDTETFGQLVQMEVGAMLVGKIQNHHPAGPVTRGDEKGMFLYGGSTIILLLEKDAAPINEAYFTATANGEETPIRMGDNLMA
ncbi:MAG: phosphatidylserine decarboxylase [Ruminococcaceae bacterium]|nr:phosphatidylserine decarboxylase [Oscillospiraceae bacterium]